MAVTRTVLPRKGFVQPQHGLTGYEADMDSNLSLLDTNVAFMSDISSTLLSDLGINGVVSGFLLSTASGLTPGLTVGVLYAQGNRYAPSTLSLAAAAASTTSYLFYNSASGFYYRSAATPATAGDALIGQVVTSGTAVTAVTTATKIMGQVTVTSAAAGNFTVAHLLGRAPIGALIRMTSGGLIWFQNPTDVDGTNLYLVANDQGETAKVLLW
jgi:hypothetical protein